MADEGIERSDDKKKPETESLSSAAIDLFKDEKLLERQPKVELNVQSERHLPRLEKPITSAPISASADDQSHLASVQSVETTGRIDESKVAFDTNRSDSNLSQAASESNLQRISSSTQLATDSVSSNSKLSNATEGSAHLTSITEPLNTKIAEENSLPPKAIESLKVYSAFEKGQNFPSDAIRMPAQTGYESQTSKFENGQSVLKSTFNSDQVHPALEPRSVESILETKDRHDDMTINLETQRHLLAFTPRGGMPSPASGIDLTSEGGKARPLDRDQNNDRSLVIPTEGKIAGAHPEPPSDPKNSDKLGSPPKDKPSDHPATLSNRSPLDLIASPGIISDGKHDSANPKNPAGIAAKGNIKSDEKITTKQADKISDKPVGDKATSSSTGPSAFIQFIESQSGLRGVSIPAVDKSEKGKKDGAKAEPAKEGATKGSGTKGEVKGESKPDKSDTTKNTKIDSTNVDKASKNDATKSGAIRGESKTVDGPKIRNVNLDGIKNKVDGFLGIVDTVKENLKGGFRGGERSPSHLSEGKLIATALKGQLPPLGDRISSAQSIAVWFPAGFVSWNIVRSPSSRPDPAARPDGKISPAREVSAKPISPTREPMLVQPPKPFDINNPPDKSRPFVQLHGADSDYKGAEHPASSPSRPEAVKWEPLKSATSKQPPQIADAGKPQKNIVDPGQGDTVKTRPVKSDTSKPAASPYLDLPGKNTIPQVDQTSTRPNQISPELAERRRKAEEQESTIESSELSLIEIASEETSEQLPAEEMKARDYRVLGEHDKRMRYVNSDIDAQESTWSSEDEAEESPHISMSRYAYIVQPGDTVESVAVAELNDLRLAPLLFSKNRKYVLPEAEYGIHPFLDGVVIDLPTPAEIAAFRQF